MGEYVTLSAADGHRLEAWVEKPAGNARAGLVLIQEIFGVNSHIRAVAGRFAAEGYLVYAPALFDRIQPRVELGYDQDSVAQGRELRGKLGWGQPILDVEAARAAASVAGKVGSVGFCWGGSLSWVAACRLPMDAAVCYYGAQIAQFRDERPNCPVMMHFGIRDPLIPAEDVAAVRTAQPAVEVHVYEAGHGFNCDQRHDFDQASSDLAWGRTTAFFAAHLA